MKTKEKININKVEIMNSSELKAINGGNIFHKITEALGYIWGELNDGHFCDTYGARVYED